MEKCMFVFIVLHYSEKSLDDTVECIESIEKIDRNKKIIIVENGSNDSSANFLLNRYDADKLVEVIISNENLGFAKGNNLGCDYAKKKYLPNFLIVINNDTIIKQYDFLNIIEKKYQEEAFHIMGPFIYDKNLNAQNPIVGLKISTKEVRKDYRNTKYAYDLLKRNYVFFYVKYILRDKAISLVRKNRIIEKFVRRIFNRERKEFCIGKCYADVGLHGSALIFSKKYYQAYNDVFFKGTFLFREENFIFYRVKRDDLVSLYCPDIKIFHKEDSSTKGLFLNNKDMNEFVLKNSLNSLRLLEEYIREDNK